MWDVIAKVSSIITIITFTFAVAAWIRRRTILKKVEKLKRAPEKDQAKLVEAILDLAKVDKATLSKNQRYDLALKEIKDKAERFKIVARIVIVFTVLAATVSSFAIWRNDRQTISSPTPTSTPNPTQSSTPSPIPTPTPKCQGKLTNSGDAFSVSDNYDPSGIIGDIDDVKIEKMAGSTRFTYETTGKGKHEWDYTYVRGELNPEPAQFGGVMYLSSPNNWALQPGYDLRKFHHLKWKARSLDGQVNVVFVIGGINWEWDHTKKEKNYNLPCPDSMPRIQTVKTLTEDWQTFDWDLSDQQEANFSSVVGGFAWMIEWGANGVSLNKERKGAVQPKTFKIEISDIRYER